MNALSDIHRWQLRLSHFEGKQGPHTEQNLCADVVFTDMQDYHSVLPWQETCCKEK